MSSAEFTRGRKETKCPWDVKQHVKMGLYVRLLLAGRTDLSSVMCLSTAGLGTTLCNTSAVNAAIASQQKSLWGIFSDQKTFPSRFIRLHRMQRRF